MAKISTAITAFDPERFVDNLQPSGSITTLKSLLAKAEPCFVNIYPGETNLPDRRNPYSEQARKGGFGKSFVLRESRLFCYQHKNAKDVLQKKDEEGAKTEMEFIDLSSQYTTKKDILCAVVERMRRLQPDLVDQIFGQKIKDDAEEGDKGESFFERFPSVIAPPSPSDGTDFDPSFVAERLFDKSVQAYFDKEDTPAMHPLQGKFVLFFDGFDEQYLGGESAPLRTWLLESLFPWLVEKMKCIVLVAGREKAKPKDIETHRLQYVEMTSFNDDKAYRYFGIRLTNKAETLSMREAVLDELWLKDTGKPSPLCEKITELTDGKPIFIDFLCALAERFCLREGGVTLAQVVGTAKKERQGKETSDEKKAFKAFLVQRLHLNSKANDSEVQRQFSEIIPLLALSRHGLSPEQYAEWRELNLGSETETGFNAERYGEWQELRVMTAAEAKKKGGKPLDEWHKQNDFYKRVKEKASRTKTFFQDQFNETELSTIVKERNLNETPTRLLHDEVVELILEHYYNDSDPTHQDRNTFLSNLLLLWEAKFLSNREHPDFPKRLLEFMEYCFTRRGRQQELYAVNRFLFEFSWHLDRHPDLCSRLLEKARKYYVLKKELCLKAQEPPGNDKTLIFSEDYYQLSKLRMREAEYHLTERRGAQWATQVQKIVEEVQAVADRSGIFDKNEELLQVLAAGSEMDFEAKLKDKFYTLKQDEHLRLLAALGALRKEKPNDFSEETALKIEDWLCAKRVPLSEHQQEGLEARRLHTLGEMKFWQQKWEEGKRDVRKSKELFFKVGDSHGLIWAEHLLGFEAQRNGRFKEASKHHRLTITNAIVYFPRLMEEYRSAEQQKDREKRESDVFGQRYRLLFLIRTLGRACSNLSVNLRYRGRLVDAIKVLESTASMAEQTGLREEIRVGTNKMLFKAIMGLNVDFLDNKLYQNYNSLFIDPLLPKRLANAAIIYETKQTGAESKVYTQLKKDFVGDSPPKNADIIKAALDRLEKAIPNQKPFLSIYDFPERDAFDAQKLSDEKYRIDHGFNFNREVADMYYQYGKMTLATHSTNRKGGNYLDMAGRAFEIARLAAQKASFLYLELEAGEALYRLAYLSEQHWGRAASYREMFMETARAIERYPKEAIGVYHDIWAKFHITEGDFVLEKALEAVFPPPDSIREAFGHYGKVLYHAHTHNQDRFLLALDVFISRVETVFELAQRQGELKEFSRTIVEVLQASDIFRLDRTFGLFLNAHLRAAAWQANPSLYNEEEMRGLHEAIRLLMEGGKFIKAVGINDSLMGYYTRKRKKKKDMDNATRRELAYRQFQTYYCYQGANRQKRVEGFLKELVEESYSALGEIVLSKAPSALASIEDAVIAVALGTSTYRTGELWNMEKFLFGELPHFREKFRRANPEALQKAEWLLHAAILTLSDPDKTAFAELAEPEQKHERQRCNRVMSEALFRLGELYILTDNVSEIATRAVESLRDKLFSLDTFKGLQAEFASESHDHTFLEFASQLAKLDEVGDQYRHIDAVQSEANAKYHRGETCKNPPHSEADMERNKDKIFKDIHQEVREIARKGEAEAKYNFPTVISKADMVEGNVFFSDIFEDAAPSPPSTSNHREEVRFKVRDKWAEHLGSRESTSTNMVKARLHKMMWSYLAGLNLLVDKGKPYENYHFHNLMFEVNRRILLIEDQRLVRMLYDDLEPVWNSFEDLSDKAELLQSLKFDIAIHEIALASKEILSPFLSDSK